MQVYMIKRIKDKLWLTMGVTYLAEGVATLSDVRVV